MTHHLTAINESPDQSAFLLKTTSVFSLDFVTLGVNEISDGEKKYFLDPNGVFVFQVYFVTYLHKPVVQRRGWF